MAAVRLIWWCVFSPAIFTATALADENTPDAFHFLCVLSHLRSRPRHATPTPTQDLCTSLAMVPFRSVESWDVTGLSLNLSVNYLSAARTGSTLRILSRTANVGRNIASVGCRIETVPHQHDADPDVASAAGPTRAGAHPETAVPSSKQGKVVATGSHLKFNAFAATKGKREASLKERQQRVQSVDGSKAPSSHIPASAL